jgi:RNA polymerase sigma factor (sigma-70 family)
MIATESSSEPCLPPAALELACVSYEELFVSELPRIERIVAAVCHRHRLGAADAEDVASFVKLKLIEDDYGILRKFQNRCRLSTYLTTVIQRLYLDYQVQRWGKWRPSAEARRRGPVAMRLESLLYRDRLPLHEAVEVLRVNFQVEESPEELRRIAEAIPPRVDRLAALGQATDAAAVVPDGEVAVRRAEVQSEAERLEASLQAALADVPAQDRLAFKLRYVESFSVAEIARRLRVEQASLYRRLEQIQRRMRQHLEARGVRAEHVRELLSESE